MKQKQKTLGQVAHEAYMKAMGFTAPFEEMCDESKKANEAEARAVVREHEKRKGVCVCDKGVRARARFVALPDWGYCPKCGKRIKVGK